jgi:citrate synthase
MRKGPLESRAWASQLEAHAVAGGDRPTLHGYDVEEDLARHYRFSDLVYLALTGDLPDDRRSRAFEIVLMFLAPISVARGPVHATVLAAYCGAPPNGLLAAAAAALSDDVAHLVQAAVDDVVPAEHRAQTPEETAAVERLRARLEGLVDVPLLRQGPCRDLALAAALRACGLESPLSLAALFAIARLPSAVAEALPRSTRHFVDEYPLDLPPFEYVE